MALSKQFPTSGNGVFRHDYYMAYYLLRYINLLVGTILTSAVKTISVLFKKPLSFKTDVMFPTASSKADTIPNSKKKFSHKMTKQAKRRLRSVWASF